MNNIFVNNSWNANFAKSSKYIAPPISIYFNDLLKKKQSGCWNVEVQTGRFFEVGVV